MFRVLIRAILISVRQLRTFRYSANLLANEMIICRVFVQISNLINVTRVNMRRASFRYHLTQRLTLQLYFLRYLMYHSNLLIFLLRRMNATCLMRYIIIMITI